MRCVLSFPVRLFLILAAWSISSAVAFADIAWYRIDAQKNVRVILYVFHSVRCPHCQLAMPWVDGMEKKYAWLEVHRFETSANPGNLDHYRSMATSMGRAAGQVPAFFFCNQLEIGYDSYERHGRRIETSLVRCYEALAKQLQKSTRADPPGREPRFLLASFSLTEEEVAAPVDPPIALELPPPDESVSLPMWGDVDPASVSLPLLTLVIAGCDSFNPCAFFVLLFLLSLMVHAHSRTRMLVVGGIFVLASGLIYFLFMAAWLNLFLIAGHVNLLTLAAGVLAIVIALVNVKDYFWFKQGPSLSIPDSAKPGLLRRMTPLIAEQRIAVMLAGTVALAVLTNLYELLCTAGFPMVYTRILTMRELPQSTYYLYLAFYNAVYIVPLALIVVAFACTLGARKLTETEGRILKLLSGNMMLALGLLLLIRPEWLTKLWAAGAILALSVAVTVLVVLLCRSHETPQPRPIGPTAT